jgi:hypothetical protein
MTDPNHELDELLRAAARDYNRPGATPRDRMWESIRAERARRALTAQPARWRRFVLPAVAAAVLVVGIAIGRLYERLTATQTSSPHVATRTAPLDSGKSMPDDLAKLPNAVAALPDGSDDTTRDTPPRAHRPASRAPRLAPQSSPNLAFRLAVVQHLAGTEALLTSFRTEAARGDVDAQVTTWARNLLTTTRLLQSAAGQQDPTMKRLLDDLELVLIQIAQYSPTNPHHAEELDLIEHSIQRRGVIGKLRTTIPARLAPSGT